MKVYLDNAATTKIDPRVAEVMIPFLEGKFGNPSSTHSHGREVKATIELARKSIAERLNCSSGEIYFTSGGTESINTVLTSVVKDLNRKIAISSPLEHHAVLHTLEHLYDSGKTELKLLDLDKKGNLDLSQLEQLLKTHSPALVSLMYANNEVGNVNDIASIGALCKEHGAFLHSDTVQAMGHFDINASQLEVDSMVCSAHKIHGPKGVGFMYLKKGHKVHSYILGGGQERNLRGGTENVMGIVGLAKAFEIAYDEMSEQREFIWGLKKSMMEKLKNKIPGVEFNGMSEDQNSLYTVLNVCLPTQSNNDMLLFQLDLNGISASGGSACNSGAQKGSHVLEALKVNPQHTSVRFSFSKYNTEEEINFVADKIEELIS